MSEFIEKLEKPIPIGKQSYAYQCENIAIEPSFGRMIMRGFIPFKTGKEPYPNAEKENIDYYELRIEKFTSNSILIYLVKKFKDGSEIEYETNMSFSFLVNKIFEGIQATIYEKEAPKCNY